MIYNQGYETNYYMHNKDPVNWEENSELEVVKLHNFNSRFPIHGKPGPKKRELGGS